MMPGLSLDHIIILGVIALVVVGPKDLPLLLRKLGAWTAKLRGMAQEFRTGFDELARQAELDELRKEVDALRRTTSLSSVAPEITKPFGTLESYAGVSDAPAPAAEAPLEQPTIPDQAAAPEIATTEPAATETTKTETTKTEPAKPEPAMAEASGSPPVEPAPAGQAPLVETAEAPSAQSAS
jgi:sec-independent protein translocase protein TatB